MSISTQAADGLFLYLPYTFTCKSELASYLIEGFFLCLNAVECLYNGPFALGELLKESRYLSTERLVDKGLVGWGGCPYSL